MRLTDNRQALGNRVQQMVHLFTVRGWKMLLRRRDEKVQSKVAAIQSDNSEGDSPTGVLLLINSNRLTKPFGIMTVRWRGIRAPLRYVSSRFPATCTASLQKGLVRGLRIERRQELQFVVKPTTLVRDNRIAAPRPRCIKHRKSPQPYQQAKVVRRIFIPILTNGSPPGLRWWPR